VLARLAACACAATLLAAAPAARVDGAGLRAKQTVRAIATLGPRVAGSAFVVAHLDGVSAGSAANDNGSGVGALVEVARELGEAPGVLYAALGAEEQVMTGLQPASRLGAPAAQR
jgi:Peptidase family M28